MYTLFVILIVIAAVLMIGIVLIQESKGGGLSSMTALSWRTSRTLSPILTTCLDSVPASRRMPLLLQRMPLLLPPQQTLPRSKRIISQKTKRQRTQHGCAAFFILSYSQSEKVVE